MSFCSHENPERSDDLQLETMSQPAGSKVVEDDFQPTLPGQNDGLGFAGIDRSREKNDAIRIGQLNDLQPG